jgi:hypothetical protein
MHPGLGASCQAQRESRAFRAWRAKHVLVRVTESEYSNDQFTLKYIHHFKRQSAKYQRGVNQILICDDSDNHLTAKFLHFCEEN